MAMSFSMPPMLTNNEAPTMPGPTRRPGNLWSTEAREDMFNRREAGEGWETICQDYPNRSRHAMQQQYSMMKKQRALENGTWSMSGRGRKRRMISADPTRVGIEIGEEDLSDELLERNRVTRLPPLSQVVGHSQPLHLGLNTDPVFLGQLPTINNAILNSKRDGSDSISPIPSSSSPDYKRQTFSEYQAGSNHLHRVYNQWQAKLPDLAFTEADVTALVQKGREQAARVMDDVNYRNELIRKSKDDEISRYVTQLREAQDQLSLEKGQGPYAQQLNRRDREIESLRGNLAGLQEALDARNSRCLFLENENAELKTRLSELGKENTFRAIGTNSPPSTPMAYRTFSKELSWWQDAIGELSKNVDDIPNHMNTVRTNLDRINQEKAPLSQIAPSIDDLDVAVGLMVRNRDKVVSAFDKLQSREA